MSRRLHWPASALVSVMAALTSWVTLLAWTSFAERASGYLVPIFGGALMVAGLGMLLRGARWHPLLVLLVQCLLLAAWLHHRWAGDVAVGGWLPTPASLQQVGATLREAVLVSGRFAAPIPKSVPAFYPIMVLLGCAVVVIVDFLAAGLRRAPLAGLPLLAVYTAPVSILDGGVSWLKFALAALCFLFLVAAEEAQRLAHWGHQLTAESRLFDSQATEVRTTVVWSSARKIGLTATALAVVAPILVPTFTGNLFDGSGNGPGGQDGSVTITNPMVDMKRDLTRGIDVELARVTTTDPAPAYLRISVLDTFDGTAWRPSARDIPVSQRADGLVPRAPGLDAGVPTTRVAETIRTSDFFQSRWLPAPYPVYSVSAPGDWRYDRRTLDFVTATDDQDAAGITYDLEELQLSPTVDQLRAAAPAPAPIYGPGTALPGGFPDKLHTLALSVTEGAPTKFAMAVRLQDWFRQDGHFTYSLAHGSGNGIPELVHFLGTGKGSRTGYCEQFAAAMAVLGRSLGIPSRVAVGFLRPSPAGTPHTWVYSSHDMHAWPEMYFQGIGWVRFEPTPQARTGALVPSYTRGQNGGPAPSAAPTTRSADSNPTNKLDRSQSTPGASSRGGTGGSGWSRHLLADGALAGLLLALLLALPRLLRDLVRRRRWSSAATPAGLAEAAWAELRASALDLRLDWDDRVTLRRRARDLARAMAAPGNADDALGRAALRGPGANPEAVAALERLVRLLERARYSRGLADPDAVAGVRADTERCVDALTAGASRAARVRATWLPVSLRVLLRLPHESQSAPLSTGQPGVDQAY